MIKRFWKNVILVCCILGLVLQPVNIFAYTEGNTYYFNSWNDFDNGVRSFLVPSNSKWLVSSSGSSLFNKFRNWLSTNGYSNINANDYFAIQYKVSQNELMYNFYPMANVVLYNTALSINTGDRCQIYANSNSTGLQYVNCFYYLVQDDDFWDDPGAFSYGQVEMLDSIEYGFWIMFPSDNSAGISGSFIQISNSTDPTSNYNKYIYDSSYIPSPLDPDPNDPASINGVNYPLNIYYQLGLMFSQNFICYTPDGQTIFNPTWVGVGQALTYDYLCKTNKNSPTVSINLANGNTVTLSNYLYGDPDYSADITNISSNVASCKSSLSTISSRVNTTNTKLNTINTTITNQLTPLNNNIADVTDRLENAFPDDQAALNDSIAETLLDDTSGSGLTAAKVSNAKSDFDDALSVYSITSNTDALSAITGGDWSFWSQTTLNNLGSGYSFNINGLLMDDIDVFESNQQTLINMLGW